MQTLFFRLFASTALLGCLCWCACSDSTNPSPANRDDGEVLFGGSLDPTQGSFVLKRIDQPGPRPFFVELVGSNVEVSPADETVSLDVALRNVGPEPLFSPAAVWVGRFLPESITVLNPDMRTANETGVPPEPPLAFGFDYTDLLGEDETLAPQELSEAKTWIFLDPGLVSFSFEAQAVFGVGPEPPMISGVLFFDVDENGRYDPHDEPYGGGHVEISGPDGFGGATHSGMDGRYVFQVPSPGLYTLVFDQFLDKGPPGCYTTPNPLEVVLPPNPDGTPQSFHRAHFGIRPGPCPPMDLRVILTELDPEQIEQDFYYLGGAEIHGDRFRFLVEFSGCQPDHPFTLYISRHFAESNPVQTWALLAHDDLDELCDALFTRTLEFDLAPLREAYLDMYGEPVEILIQFRDFFGNQSSHMFGP